MEDPSPSVPTKPLTLCLLQPPLRRDDQHPIESTKEVIELMQQAVLSFGNNINKQQLQQQQRDGEDTDADHQQTKITNKIDLILLPELCPVGYSEDSFSRFLPNTKENRTLHAKIDEELQEAAKRMNCAICYGTMGWKNTRQSKDGEEERCAENNNTDNNNNVPPQEQDELLFTIRQVVVDHEGTRIASYDKIHVCDYGDCMETRFFTPGTKPCSFTLPGNKDDNKDDCWTFGLMICADMRYPNLAQTLVQNHYVHVLLQPASFARDISFRTWKSFRETRAVECGTYFLANNYAGVYFGQTSMNPPWIDEAHEPKVLGTEVSYIVETLDPKILYEARTTFPFYRHTMNSKSCTGCGLLE